MSHVVFIVIGVCFALWFVVMVVFMKEGALFVQALLSGAPVSFMDILGMKLRKTDAEHVIRTAIRLAQAGIPVPVARIERHLLAGGDIDLVAESIIVAKNRGQELTFDKAVETDLARRGGR